MYSKYYNKIIYRDIEGYLAVTDITKKLIALNSKIKFTKIEKEIIIAHECAHILLKSFSHSLVWQTVFFDLLKKLKKQYGKDFDKTYINLIKKYNYSEDGIVYGKLN